MENDTPKTTPRERDPNCPFAPYGCHEHGPDGCETYLDPDEFDRVLNIINNPPPPTPALKRLFAAYRENERRRCANEK